MTLDEYLHSEDSVIANAASLTKQAMFNLKDGNLSLDMYKNLTASFLDLSAVIGITDDMERKDEITKALTELKDIASDLTFLK